MKALQRQLWTAILRLKSRAGLGRALVKACAAGDIGKIEMLLQYGADVHFNNDAALRVACRCNKPEAARLLIEKNAHIYHENFSGTLYWAAVCKQREIIDLFLQNGLILDHGGNSVLRGACASSDRKFAAYILGSVLQKQHDFDMNLALMLAARHNLTQEMTALFNRGAKPHSEALWRAAARGQTDAVKILIEKGADISAQNYRAHREAGFSGKTQLLELLKPPSA